MKNKFKFVGIIVFIAVIGFGMAACKDTASTVCVHDWEWKITTPATKDAEGVETETCSKCGTTRNTRTIDKIVVPPECDCSDPCTITNCECSDCPGPVTIITFTVTYNGNESTGGAVPVDIKRYTSGETVTVLGSGNLEKTGYSFVSWNTQDDGEGIDYIEGDTFVITANAVFYAHWLEDAHGILLFENDDDITSSTLIFTSAAFGYLVQNVKTITVVNDGNQATGTLTVALSGSGSGDFTVSGSPLSSINVDGTGTFTIRPNTGLAAGSHTATVSISGSNASASFMVSFTVDKAPGVFGSPDAVGAVYTPALKLENISLPTGYTWNEPSTTLDVSKSGQSFSATFIDPSNNYLPAHGSVTVNVEKAVGSFGTPAAIPATFSATLTLADLTLVNGYVWDDDSTQITTATNGQTFPATFTDPSGNYLPATGNLTVNVAKAVGSFVNHPAIDDITYTTTLTLADIDLEDDYEWNAPQTSVNAGSNQFSATFTDPSGNYLPATGNITVNVAKAVGATTISAPEVIARTHNSVTVDAITVSTEQLVQYASNTTNVEPETGWQNGVLTIDGVLITGLNPGTTYYIFARAASDDNYNQGATSNGTAITTMQTAVFAFYWVNQQGQIATTDYANGDSISLSKGEGQKLTIDADGVGYSVLQWSVNGIVDPTVAPGATQYIFSSAGKTTGARYIIDLLVEKDNKFYMTSFAVTVTE